MVLSEPLESFQQRLRKDCMPLLLHLDHLEPELAPDRFEEAAQAAVTRLKFFLDRDGPPDLLGCVGSSGDVARVNASNWYSQYLPGAIRLFACGNPLTIKLLAATVIQRLKADPLWASRCLNQSYDDDPEDLGSYICTPLKEWVLYLKMTRVYDP
jgi:hypothetical protein